jgi:hypothetical protein
MSGSQQRMGTLRLAKLICLPQMARIVSFHQIAAFIHSLQDTVNTPFIIFIKELT